MSGAWPSSENESGLEIEESLRTKLETFSERKISWNGTEPESLSREIEELLIESPETLSGKRRSTRDSDGWRSAFRKASCQVAISAFFWPQHSCWTR
jgi:hypothetical protein